MNPALFYLVNQSYASECLVDAPAFVARGVRWRGSVHTPLVLHICAALTASPAACCCGFQQCPNGTCWLPANLLYPCDTLDHFKQYLVTYIDDRITPIAVVAILIGLIQFVTAIAACCNQCKGKSVEAAKPMGGPLSYDGYADESAEYGGYGYESYVKTGAR